MICKSCTGKMKKVKKAGRMLMTAMLSLAVFFSSVPLGQMTGILAAEDYTAEAAGYSGTLVQKKLGDYSFKSSRYMEIYTTRYQDSSIYIGSCTEAGMAMHRFLIDDFLVFCAEHGVTQKSVRLKSVTRENSRVSAAYEKSGYRYAIDNMFRVLLYGPTAESSLSELKRLGFNDSAYCGRNGSPDMASWIAATQMLIWESQQLMRNEKFEKVQNGLNYQNGYRGTATGPISKNHYSSNLAGTPAQDIYDWMASQIKKRTVSTAAIEKNTLNVFRNEEGKYCTVDSSGNGVPVSESNPYTQVLKGTEKYMITDKDGKPVKGVSISYDSAKKKNTLTITSQDAFKEKLVIKLDDEVLKRAGEYTAKSDKYKKLFWEFETEDGHTQGFISGFDDPAAGNLTINEKTIIKKTEPETCERAELEFFPTVNLTIEKKDSNPGFDNDPSTPMGDSGLNAEYTLERSIAGGEWEVMDSTVLDEYGTETTFSDRPFSDYQEMEEYLTETGELTNCAHPITDEDGNVTGYEHEGSKAPTKAQWHAEVKYRITETRPEGRYIDPDRFGGVREYTLTYDAETHDTCEAFCTGDPWTDIQYDFTLNVTKGEGSTVKESGTDPAEELNAGKETFTDDIQRGEIQIIKSNETENVFKDSAMGTSEISVNSMWTVCLENEGFEGCRYLHLVSEKGEKLSGGTLKYTVSRNGGSYEMAADKGVKVGSNGTLLISDVPYGRYIVREVSADNPCYVLEEFRVEVAEHGSDSQSAVPYQGSWAGYSMKGTSESGTVSTGTGDYYNNRYDVNLRDKIITNVVKLVKTDEETGKTVRMEGTEVFLRYKGNPDYSDQENVKRYGENGTVAKGIYNRYLPNAESIDSTARNYAFSLNENGELIIPYELPYGKYEILEWNMPEGYCFNGKDEEINGTPVNIYEFTVTKQDAHKDGNIAQLVTYDGVRSAADSGYEKSDYPYIKTFTAAAIPNKQVKGKIEVTKTGEVLTGYKEEVKSGYTVLQPVFEMAGKLRNAVFGIFAAEDIRLNDGSEGPDIIDAESGETIVIRAEKRTNLSGLKEKVIAFFGSGHEKEYAEEGRYETGELSHESGAKLWYLSEREASENNVKRTLYVTPEEKDTSYSCSYESEDEEYTYEWNVKVNLSSQAGGRNISSVDIIKTTTAKGEPVPEISVTKASGAVGNHVMDILSNYMTVSDPLSLKNSSTLEVLENINIVEEEVVKEPENSESGENAGNDSDSKGGEDDSTGGTPDDSTTDTENGEGTEVKDENSETPENSENPENSGTEDNNDETENKPVETEILQRAVIQEYQIRYTDEPDDRQNFSFEFDGICFSAEQQEGDSVKVTLENGTMKPADEDISLGQGWKHSREKDAHVFETVPVEAPVYFTWKDATKVSMYYRGNAAFTKITLPQSAVEYLYESIVPGLKFSYMDDTEGAEEKQIMNLDWYSSLSPSSPVREFSSRNGLPEGVSVKSTARYSEKPGRETQYTIEIVTNQNEKAPLSISFRDGYTMDIYCAEAADGKGVGIFDLHNVYKTTRYSTSQLIERITTNEEGKAVSSELPLGKYIVRELSAADGYVNSEKDGKAVELSFKNAHTALVWARSQEENRFMKVDIQLAKVFETAFESGEFTEPKGNQRAVFGLFADERIEAQAAGTAKKDSNHAEKDQLLDVITISSADSGRGAFSTRLPFGKYYIRELSVNDGSYEPSPLKYSFEILPQEEFSAPETFNGKAGSGITGNIILTESGHAVTEIKVENRMPMPEITVDGKIYPLSESIRILRTQQGGLKPVSGSEALTGKEREYLTVKSESDFTTVTVHSYDDGNGTPAEIILPDGKNVSVTAGKNGFAWEEDGEIHSYIIEEGHSYTAELPEDEKTDSDSDNSEAENNPETTENDKTHVETSGSVTVMKRQNTSQETLQIRVNWNGEDIEAIRNYKKETPDNPGGNPGTPSGPSYSEPCIRTSAADGNSGGKDAVISENMKIVDTVTYSGLIPGREYILKGILMDASSGKEMIVKGKNITAETTFRPEKSSGTVQVVFIFDGSDLKEMKTVVFETLYKTEVNAVTGDKTENRVTEHSDLKDENQTVNLVEDSEEEEEEHEQLETPEKPRDKGDSEDEKETITDEHKHENGKPDEGIKESTDEGEDVDFYYENNDKPDSDVPKTGDENSILLWLALMFMSFAAICFCKEKKCFASTSKRKRL